MKYNLQFVKISPEHEFAGVGFAGNIFIVLNALTRTAPEDKLYVDMATNECVCTERGVMLHGTNNCWEYYFDQILPPESEDCVHMDSLSPGNIRYDDKVAFMYPENFIELKSKFYNSFSLKPYLVELLDEYYANVIKDKTTLGVQIRLTDMKHYHNVAPVALYIEKINQILLEKPEIKQIFLATDDSTIIETVEREVNVPVHYYKDMFRADKQNTHLHPYDRFIGDRTHHKYKLGIECIQEVFTLAKCDYLLQADISAISIVASILSENIKTVYKL
jgi:hypothetical protein